MLRHPPLPALLAGLAIAGTAAAHDTWFEPLPATKPGEVLVALGTGNQFPLHETAVGEEFLRQRGCRSGGAAAVPLATVRYTATSAVLRSAIGGNATCWVELVPLDVELAPDKITLYLKEINASPAVRQAWADMQARGIGWKERYTKHARIELRGAGAAPLGPVDMGMDVLLESGLDSLRAGETAVFRVLRDGAPLPDLAVELRGNRSPIGLWSKTDGEGRVRMRLPLAGRWVLRGVDLRLSPTRPDTWDSRFVTLAFEVGAPR